MFHRDSVIVEKLAEPLAQLTETHDPHCSMIKSALPVTLLVKRKDGRQNRRRHCLNGTNGQDKWGPPRQQGQRGASRIKMGSSSSLVIQHREMDLFFRLFEDDIIHDFLKMDCCYKMTDKYLLAMTFVYFKRACFTTAEFTRRNFFLALYLANTMEEDEEKSKYEIFPWALGKSWRKQFPGFLQQRDELWARLEFRAAVSRRCCDEVMAIKSSHSVWQRQRSEHHSGAKREYGDQDYGIVPCGPSVSPVSCDLCAYNGKRPHHPASSSSSSSKGKPQASYNSYPLTSPLSLEVTPPKPTKSRARHCKARYQEEPPRNLCESTYDLFMDWINEE